MKGKSWVIMVSLFFSIACSNRFVFSILGAFHQAWNQMRINEKCKS